MKAIQIAWCKVSGLGYSTSKVAFKKIIKERKRKRQNIVENRVKWLMIAMEKRKVERKMVQIMCMKMGNQLLLLELCGSFD